MIATHTEATTKLCPYTKNNCVASACMMWRTTSAQPMTEGKRLGISYAISSGRFKDRPTSEIIAEALKNMTGFSEGVYVERIGYCGLNEGGA